MSLIKARKRKKKPKFKRQEWFRLPRLGKKWRKPKGRFSKLRLRKKTRGRVPSPGFSSPRGVRGLDRTGRIEVSVANPQDLTRIKGNMVAVVKKGVGRKKRIEIATAAESAGVKVKNIKKVFK